MRFESYSSAQICNAKYLFKIFGLFLNHRRLAIASLANMDHTYIDPHCNSGWRDIDDAEDYQGGDIFKACFTFFKDYIKHMQDNKSICPAPERMLYYFIKAAGDDIGQKFYAAMRHTSINWSTISINSLTSQATSFTKGILKTVYVANFLTPEELANDSVWQLRQDLDRLMKAHLGSEWPGFWDGIMEQPVWNKADAAGDMDESALLPVSIQNITQTEVSNMCAKSATVWSKVVNLAHGEYGATIRLPDGTRVLPPKVAGLLGQLKEVSFFSSSFVTIVLLSHISMHAC
jgi:hypothetical protein